MGNAKEWTHSELCSVAVKWLKRANSNNGHGCHVAVSEVKSGWTGEIPDAIGFRQSGYAPSDGSVVVEVKVSRGDFLSDKKKPHRIEGGLGNWRYFMCPEGMIQPDELPEGWGLLWVNSRGHVKPKAGFACALADSRNYYNRQEALAAYRQNSDWDGEKFILVKLFSRIGDPEAMNLKLREAFSEQSRLAQRCNSMSEELHKLKLDLWTAKRRAPDGNESSENSGSRKSPLRPAAGGNPWTA